MEIQRVVASTEIDDKVAPAQVNEVITSAPFDLGAAAAEPVVEAGAVVKTVIRDAAGVKGVVAVSTAELCRREIGAIKRIVVGPAVHQGLTRRRQVVRPLFTIQPVIVVTIKSIVA